MGTRGAWGFRKDAQDKISYNQRDSYPEGLGSAVAELVRQSRHNAHLAEIADGIVLVQPDTVPDADTITYCQNIPGLVNLSVSDGKPEDWYCLLYGAHRQPLYYLQGATLEYDEGDWQNRKTASVVVGNPCRHMVDNAGFLADSLFCEFAYIINLDSEKLEVYRGFNRCCSAPGRYAGDGDEGPADVYYGVALIAEFGLDEVRGWTSERFMEAVAKAMPART